MCRNIKTLHNFAPPATEEEIRASALQFVRKLSGFTKPSKANEETFNRAVDKVTEVACEPLRSLVTNAPPLNREIEILKARERSAKRFAVPVVAGRNHGGRNAGLIHRWMRLWRRSLPSQRRTDHNVQLSLP